MGDLVYWVTFAGLFLPLVALIWSQGVGSLGDSKSRSLAANFLLVYCLQMLGDWLQGPYVYAVHEAYGYSPAENGRLFIAGFAASLVVGTFVGALADRHGRRTAGLAYVATYSASCLTKHFSNFWILLAGRVAGGVASSLLHSAFESWLVAEHFKNGFSEQALNQTFAMAFFLGNGLMAILAGFLGEFLVEWMQLGRVAPFDAAIVFMLVGGAIMICTWAENYGDKDINSLGEQFGKALEAIQSDRAVALLGAMQSLFEAPMYAFVFLWTLAMSPNGEAIKHGLIFVNFMTAAMAGSFLASVLMRRVQPERYMRLVFGVATGAMAVPMVVALNAQKDPGLKAAPITLAGVVQLAAFCVFELCVDMFWPSIMSMRAKHVPEELRATIINIFRIPLNIFVCLVLGNVGAVPLAALFGLCVLLLTAACWCQVQLERLPVHGKYSHVSSSSTDEEAVDGGAATGAGGDGAAATAAGSSKAE